MTTREYQEAYDDDSVSRRFRGKLSLQPNGFVVPKRSKHLIPFVPEEQS